jgi:hypothetical protein
MNLRQALARIATSLKAGLRFIPAGQFYNPVDEISQIGIVPPRPTQDGRTLNGNSHVPRELVARGSIWIM